MCSTDTTCSSSAVSNTMTPWVERPATRMPSTGNDATSLPLRSFTDTATMRLSNMTQVGETEHLDEPWWSRIPRVWWVVAIVAVLVMLGIAVIEKVGEPAPMPYSTFLDQLDAGNVASVT